MSSSVHTPLLLLERTFLQFGDGLCRKSNLINPEEIFSENFGV